LLQTDLSRHLDELAAATEINVFTAVGEELIEQRHDVARRILQAWETFQNAALDEEPSRTLSAETRFFQQRAKLLEEVLLILGSRATNILSQLRDVVNRAKSAGTLNAGGRFEWVDSLLVKVCVYILHTKFAICKNHVFVFSVCEKAVGCSWRT
jgi:hypothetical protein